jgi:hypothetical protein
MKLRVLTAADQTKVRLRQGGPRALAPAQLTIMDMQGRPGSPAKPAGTTPSGVSLPAQPAKPPRPPAAPTPPPAKQPEPPQPKKPTGLTLKPSPREMHHMMRSE